MKHILFVAFAFTLFSFIDSPSSSLRWTDIKNRFAKTASDFYVGKYEVTNLEYRIFLEELLKSGQTESYTQYLPDTTVFRNDHTYNEPFVVYYFRHPSYNNYPVVGISYEAANAYCKWLTETINQGKRKSFKTVQFKLPSKDEWMYAANAGDTSKVFTWGSGFMQNNRKQYLASYKRRNEICNDGKERSIMMASADAYYPSTLGVYNMCGNVAEMIDERGIAKGGSYLDPAWNIRIASEKAYSKPQADIGFRVAMKVIEK